jgi:RES domain-containing protein
VIVWRFSRFETLDGRGGLLASARWHTRGREIIYTAPNPATALLEVLVHAEVRNARALGGYRFLKIEIEETIARERVERSALTGAWRTDVQVTRAVGDAWLAAARTVVLEAPSVILPETWNVLVNPRHAEAGRVRVLEVVEYPMDERLG